MNALAHAEPEAAALHPTQARTADYSGQSNLALAFISLPRAKRADMNVFYTFCRLVDDIADSPTLPPCEKTRLLDAWRAVVGSPVKEIMGKISGGIPALMADDLRLLIAKYHLPPAYLLEIIAGVEMDIAGHHYISFDQLYAYCYRVASVVGLVSIEIFGYYDVETKQYAVDLGLALQLTNIIRDVAVDLDNGERIYLPLEDLERFGYTTADLRGRVYDKRFQALMVFEAKRAEEYYLSAVSHLPASDKCSMVAAEIMRSIYARLLGQMRRDRFRVFEKRYRLSTFRKIAVMARTALSSYLY